MPEGASDAESLAAALEREVASALGLVGAQLRRSRLGTPPLIPVAMRFRFESDRSAREIEVSLGPAGLETVERAATAATGGAANGR
jgi:hypothetical protein